MLTLARLLSQSIKNPTLTFQALPQTILATVSGDNNIPFRMSGIV